MMNYHNSSIEANANRAAKMADAENHRLVQETQGETVGAHKAAVNLLLVTVTRVATLVATK